MRYGSNYRYGFPDFPELENGLKFYAHYDGQETIENNYTGNALSVKGQMPVLAGGTIFRHGINNNNGRTKAIEAAIARTNLWWNPSVETNTTSYSALVGATLNRTYRYSRYGSYCLETVTPGAAALEGWQTPLGVAGIPVVAGNSYVLSYFAMGTGTITNLIVWLDGAGGFIGSSAGGNTVLSSDWQRIIQIAVAPVGAAFANLRVQTPFLQAITFYTDAVQFETGTYVTPYLDGSLGVGHAWTGAAHASTSTRTATTMSYSDPTSCIDPLIGTVSAWIRVDGGLAGVNQYVLHAPGATAGHIRIYVSNNVIFGVWGVLGAISGGVLTTLSYRHVAMTYDGTTLRLYLDGVQVASGAASGFSGAVASFNVGNDSAGANQLNGFIDDLAVWDTVLTAAQILEIKNYGKGLGWLPVDYEYDCGDPNFFSVNDVATYVGNQNNKANITHMYWYDTSAGAFSTNLMTAILPFNLLPDPMGVGDILYIGCETALLDSGPFFDAVFDYLGSVDGITGVLEYWNGGAWAAMSVSYNDTEWLTYTFHTDRQGSRSMWWRTLSNVALYTLVIGAMNITGYWVRLRLTGVVTNTPPPIQTRRLPFAVTWSSALVPIASAEGDTQAEIQAQLDGLYRGAPYNYSICAGTRSIGRGEDFKSHLNWADEQNPVGMTAVLVSGTASFRNNLRTPTGSEIFWNPAAVVANFTDIAYIDLASPLAQQYWGSFRVFLRNSLTAGAGYITLRLQLVAGTTTGGRVWTSNLEYAAGAGTWQENAFKEVLRIPPGFSNYRIYIQGTTASNTDALSIEDLILIPCDESYWEAIVDISGGFGIPSFRNYHSMLINRLDNPKGSDNGIIIRTYDDGYVDTWQTRTEPPFIQANADQRIWTFTGFTPSVGPYFTESRPLARVSYRYSGNYLMMRGKS